MARILYWNIGNFGFNKIRLLGSKRNHAGVLQPDYNARDRRNLILRHITAFNPDIFVVVEVGTGANPVGSLLTQTGGWEGCELLRQQLAALPGAAQWNLVPPLVVGTGGRAEAVAVFYKRTTAAGNPLYFTGPNQWSNLGGGQSFVPGAMGAPAAAAYALAIRNVCFPNGSRANPAGTLYNGNVQENLCAARVAFVDGLGAAINYGGLRSPYLTTFSETDALGNVLQNINLFAIHSPPRTQAARNFLNGLANVADIQNAPGGNDVNVIVGDFNLNLLTNANNTAAWYNGLTALGYVKQLQAAGAPPAPLNGYQGYFATHLKKQNSVVFWSSAVNNLYYPAYSYIGSNNASTLYSIDNVLVWGGAANNFTIANSVTGSPLNVVPMPVPGNPPMGAVAFASSFQAPPMGWPANPAPAFARGDRQIYRQWRNFGHIRSTSDHLALYVEV